MDGEDYPGIVGLPMDGEGYPGNVGLPGNREDHPGIATPGVTRGW